MKKILFPIIFGIIVILLTGLVAYAGPVEDQKKDHIIESFNNVVTEFYERADQRLIDQGYLFLEDETNPEKHYYLTIRLSALGHVISINASIQTELENDVVTICNEGIRVNPMEGGYIYYNECHTVFRNENCRIEDGDPIEGLWDAIMWKFFDSK